MPHYYFYCTRNLCALSASYASFLIYGVPNMQPLLENRRLRLKRPFGPHQLFRVVLAALQPLRIHPLILCIPSGLHPLMLLRLLFKPIDSVPRKKAANTHNKGFNIHGFREALL